MYVLVVPRNRVVDVVIVITNMLFFPCSRFKKYCHHTKLRSRRHCPTCRRLSDRLLSSSRQLQSAFWRQIVSSLLPMSIWIQQLQWYSTEYMQYFYMEVLFSYQQNKYSVLNQSKINIFWFWKNGCEKTLNYQLIEIHLYAYSI